MSEAKNVWRVIAPDGREWRNPRLMAAVAAAIEETKLQFPADATAGVASPPGCAALACANRIGVLSADLE